MAENLAVFFGEVPVLQLIGSTQLIDSSIPYDVDEDVQLVCKYLKAYEEGMINMLYYDEQRPVKFYTDPDLPDKDCHQLLNKYMKPHVASTKTTQQLFVR